jgi:hypothetical protein
MLDSNTAYTATAAAAAALVSIVVIARISEWSSRRRICTNFKDISLDIKLHTTIVCLGVPELLTINLVLFVVHMSLNDDFHRICKPYRLHHTGEFYNRFGHDDGKSCNNIQSNTFIFIAFLSRGSVGYSHDSACHKQLRRSSSWQKGLLHISK